MCRSLSKGAYGIGDVVLEPLPDVWASSRVRINNSLDNKSRPFPKEQSRSSSSSGSGTVLRIWIRPNPEPTKKIVYLLTCILVG